MSIIGKSQIFAKEKQNREGGYILKNGYYSGCPVHSSRFTVSHFAFFFIAIILNFVISVRYNLSLSDNKPSESIRMPLTRPQYFSHQTGFNLHRSPTVNP